MDTALSANGPTDGGTGLRVSELNGIEAPHFDAPIKIERARTRRPALWITS